MTDEEAYEEIAEKLMDLSDSMDVILACVADVEAGLYTPISDLELQDVEEGFGDVPIT